VKKKITPCLSIKLDRWKEKGRGVLKLGVGNWGGWGYAVKHSHTRDLFSMDISSCSKKDIESILNGCGFGKINLRQIVTTE